MRDKKDLQKAKNDKCDEFYTQYEDVEKEMVYYTEHFKDKIIYCNTDDISSNFWKYFENNFEKLGLKKLIATKYNKDGKGEKYELEIINGEKIYKKELLNDNGDFRNNENIEILKQSDIIVTNPPFSLFRIFVKQLIKYNKKFIIIGNQNAITYKDVFPLIKDNLIWLGVSIKSGTREFQVPKNYGDRSTMLRIDENNNKFISMKGVRWFTNLKHNLKNNKIELIMKYNNIDYPKYDNYDAIEVSKTKNIPYDYYDIMGVPITFLDKYNSEQFEIIGIINGSKDMEEIPLLDNSYSHHPYVNGKKKYARILIKRRDV